MSDPNVSSYSRMRLSLRSGKTPMNTAIMVTGQIGSGKSTVAAFVSSNCSLQLVSFGEFIRYIALESGLPATRKSLQELGDKTFRELGAQDFLQKALHLAGVGQSDSVVLDGVRHLEIMREIRSTAQESLAIYLNVCQEKRFWRHRSRLGCRMSFREFQAADNHAVETEVGTLAEHCDLVIDASQPLVDVKRNLLCELDSLSIVCDWELKCLPH